MTDSRGTHTYQYDALYRLIGVDYPEGRSQEWEYDATGNRLSEIETLPSQTPDTTLYHYSQDRLDSTTGFVARSFGYDPNGSLTQRDAEVFRYDSKMRLREARVPGQPVNVMTYDPMGLRVQTVSSEGKIGYLIDPTSNQGQFNTMSVAAEYKNGVKSREFGLGTRADEVLWEENGEGLFYLLYDGLGSVVALTNANGQVVGNMAYDAFGKVFNHTGTQGRYGFTGRPTDPDIGLQYNRARFYDAGVGRWNGADEYRGEPVVPASLHRYVYVSQNSINSTDPSGFKAFDDAFWASQIAERAIDFFAAAFSTYRNPAVSKIWVETAPVAAKVFFWFFFAAGITDILNEAREGNPLDCVFLELLLFLLFARLSFVLGGALILPAAPIGFGIGIFVLIGLFLSLANEAANFVVESLFNCEERCKKKK